MPTNSKPRTRRRAASQARTSKAIVPASQVQRRILLIRGERVLLDLDLATMYGVTTGVLNQAVKRNLSRFPGDFMFQLTSEEAKILKSQIVISSSAGKRWGGHRSRPQVFTEQGVAMLSSVLRSPRAVKVNIEIMRAFVRLRQLLSTHADLAARLDELESKYDKQFGVVFDAIRALMTDIDDDEDGSKRPRIGFKTPRHDRPEARRHIRGPRRKQLAIA